MNEQPSWPNTPKALPGKGLGKSAETARQVFGTAGAANSFEKGKSKGLMFAVKTAVFASWMRNENV